MNQSPIHLTFNCPQKWEAMTAANGGRFCAECKKTVTDFSKVPLNKLDTFLQAEHKEELCGNFQAKQLDKPFNDWRDRIISFYQGVVLGTTANKVSRQFMLLLLMLVLVATGCISRVKGRMVASDPGHYKKCKDKTTQTALPPTEKK